ncbi:MAG TPA: glycosyltransferase [Thermoanaerobaculia bacterium]|nr:glycosyltransferase [Thermoanaerobaculia bacterium]
MRILHVIPTYVPAWRHGGPVYSTHGLARAQARAGHEVHVLTTTVNGNGDLDVPRGRAVEVDGVSVTYFPTALSRRLYVSPGMGRALAASIDRFDVAHLHSLFLWPPAAAGHFARKAGVPYFVAPRGMLVRELVARQGRLRKRLWLALIDRRNLEGAAGIHVTSELEAAEARRFGFRLPPVQVIPNGLDAEVFARDPETPPPPRLAALFAAGPFFLFLGRISWKKGLERLIAALPGVPAARLAVAGNDEEGLLPRLAQQARELGVAERVAFLGAVEGDEKAWLLRRCAALVLPSLSENFGNVVLEAWAAGRPAVVTPEVGLAAEVTAAGAGLVAPGDPESLGAALTTLLADPGATDEMGSRGATRVRERYGWDAIAARVEGMYRGIGRTDIN